MWTYKPVLSENDLDPILAFGYLSRSDKSARILIKMPFIIGRENTASGCGDAVKFAVRSQVMKAWNLVTQSVPTALGEENGNYLQTALPTPASALSTQALGGALMQ